MIKQVVGNVLARIPIAIAQVIALCVGILSFIGTIFLAIGVETHKFFETNTGKKLLEIEVATRKVADYMAKVKNQAATGEGVKTPAQTKASSETNRLLNIVKTNGEGNEG